MTFHNNLGCSFINPFHVNAKRSWSNFTTTILVHDWWNIWNKAKPTVIQLLVIRLLPEIALFASKGRIISLSLNMIMSYELLIFQSLYSRSKLRKNLELIRAKALFVLTKESTPKMTILGSKNHQLFTFRPFQTSLSYRNSLIRFLLKCDRK